MEVSYGKESMSGQKRSPALADRPGEQIVQHQAFQIHGLQAVVPSQSGEMQKTVVELVGVEVERRRVAAGIEIVCDVLEKDAGQEPKAGAAGDRQPVAAQVPVDGLYSSALER